MSLALRGFYAILDLREPPLGDGADVLARAELLLAAAPCALQLRAKGLPVAIVRDLAARILPLCHGARVPFCINDRVDLALAVGADVVHVGQEDLSLADTLSLVRNPDASPIGVGVSTHNLDQALEAERGGADYIGFGPIFATGSKANPDPVVGLESLAEVVRSVTIPVVAIGGITLDRVEAVAATGAAAAAVISSVEQAADVTAAGRLVAAAFADVADAGAKRPRTRKRPLRLGG